MEHMAEVPYDENADTEARELCLLCDVQQPIEFLE